jgi:hypothetical protein
MSDKNHNLNEAWNIYKELLYNIPYNSVTHLYIYLAGKKVPSNYGMPCVLQLDELMRRFTKAGFSYTIYVDQRHATIVVPIEGELYLFDPYLLHSEPVCLSKCEDGKYYSFEAFPYRIDKEGRKISSQYRVQINRQDALLKTKYAQYQEKDDKFLSIRSFRFDMKTPIPGLPKAEVMVPQFFHPEQTTLSCRVLCKSDSKIYQVIYPICWYFRSGMHNKSNLLIKLNNGEMINPSSPRFQFYLEKVAFNMDLTQGDIIDFILEGVNVYEKYAPEMVNFYNYKPVFS